MVINNIFHILLEDQKSLNSTGTKPIVDAVKNRNPITFYYTGPARGKDSVKSGPRYRVEGVALGLSKKGNLVLRGWVRPPSTTKSGFSKSGWRTFILSRMSNVTVLDKEMFDQKRPGYKEGNDSSMTVTYVTSDWTKQPKTKKVQKPEPVKAEPQKPEPTVAPQEKPKPEVQPTEPKQVEPQKQELPQPKPEKKPEPVEEPPVEPTQTSNPKYDDEQKRLYNIKKQEWINKQKEIGGNIKPGQGTRARFSKEVEKELSQPKPEVKPTQNPEDQEDETLKESINKIKRLMFS